ncbi:MAG: alkyl hydroperoxide reductase, partial [Thermomicrobiales bacterium]|nr:alkyl hydroperoxide reductase [Thermomicrobiales bacterium]
AVVGAGAAGFVDGAGGAARFRAPRGMALLPDGRTLAVADTANHALRAVDLDTFAVTTLAGTGGRADWHSRGGPGRSVALASPWGVAWFAGAVWIAMAGLHQLWRYDPTTGMVEPAAGTGAEALHDGSLQAAAFAQPSGVAPLGEALYVVCAEASAVRRVDPRADRVRRLIGRGLFVWGDTDGVGDAALMQHPQGIAAEAAGTASSLWIADTYNHAIRVLDPATRRLETLTGGGPALVDGELTVARFNEPSAVAMLGDRLFVADTNNHALRAIDLAHGQVDTWPIE